MGGGIIGLSLSIALRKRGVRVLVVERGEPGREASHAAAGMLADCPLRLRRRCRHWLRRARACIQSLSTSYRTNRESRSTCAIRARFCLSRGAVILRTGGFCREPLPAPLAELEPALADEWSRAVYLKERSVDPRALVAAALKAAKHRGVDISSGTTVTDVLLSDGQSRRRPHGSNALHRAVCGELRWRVGWQFLDASLPYPPGQRTDAGGGLRRAKRLAPCDPRPEVYLVPRSDGRILIGSTLEEAGYDKRTDVDTIQRLHQAAIRMVPALGQARILEDWAGLRPGTSGRPAHSWRDQHTRILRGYRTLSRWNLAHAGYGAGDGAGDHGRATRLRYFGVYSDAISELMAFPETPQPQM